MVNLLRVDHRLLHGQVAFSWTSALGVDCILIANDSVLQDEIRKTTLKLSKPNGVKLVIKSIDDSIEAINSGKTDKYNLFIIVESIKDAEKLALSCSAVKNVNLGGTKNTEGKKKISKAIFVTNDDIQSIRNMHENNINVEIRQIPADSKMNAVDAI